MLNRLAFGWASSRRSRLLVFPLLVIAGSHTLQAERLPIKTYTIADGLGHNSVRRIVKDSRGFLWFCTEEGLSRFDGHRFVNYGSDHGLPRGSVNGLLETRGGDYWLATDDGLVHFDPKAAQMFTTVTPPDGDRRARTITAVFEARDGSIWIGTRKDVYRLDGPRDHPSLRQVEVGLPNRFPDE